MIQILEDLWLETSIYKLLLNYDLELKKESIEMTKEGKPEQR